MVVVCSTKPKIKFSFNQENLSFFFDQFQSISQATYGRLSFYKKKKKQHKTDRYKIINHFHGPLKWPVVTVENFTNRPFIYQFNGPFSDLFTILGMSPKDLLDQILIQWVRKWKHLVRSEYGTWDSQAKKSLTITVKLLYTVCVFQYYGQRVRCGE